MRSASAFRLAGELDMASVPAVERQLLPLLVEIVTDLPSGPIVLDCSGVTFIDSTGVAMLIRFSRTADERLQLVNVPRWMARVLHIVCVAEGFGIDESQFVE